MKLRLTLECEGVKFDPCLCPQVDSPFEELWVVAEHLRYYFNCYSRRRQVEVSHQLASCRCHTTPYFPTFFTIVNGIFSFLIRYSTIFSSTICRSFRYLDSGDIQGHGWHRWQWFMLVIFSTPPLVYYTTGWKISSMDRIVHLVRL